MNGFLLTNKNEGSTSFNVVCRAKELFDTEKIGHTGTLDPFASGLLILTVNNYTRLSFLFDDMQKEYIASGVFGFETDTEDITGSVIKCESSNRIITREDFQNIIENNFNGEIYQVPPRYSAKHINGKRAYKLVREGVEFDMDSIKITIHNIELLSYNYPYFDIKLSVSKGTYIRSIVRDIGRALSTLACTHSLIRTSIGNISLDSAKDISPNNLISFSNIFTSLDTEIVDDELFKSRLLSGDKNAVAHYTIKSKYKIFLDTSDEVIAIIHKDETKNSNRYKYVPPNIRN